MPGAQIAFPAAAYGYEVRGYDPESVRNDAGQVARCYADGAHFH